MTKEKKVFCFSNWEKKKMTKRQGERGQEENLESEKRRFTCSKWISMNSLNIAAWDTILALEILNNFSGSYLEIECKVVKTYSQPCFRNSWPVDLTTVYVFQVFPSKIDPLCHMSRSYVKGNTHLSVKGPEATTWNNYAANVSNFNDLVLIKQMSKPNLYMYSSISLSRMGWH